MARIRTLKPEFWSSPGVETLDPFARLLFVAMWNWADDYGVGVANPRELLGFAFPLDEQITVGDVRGWLDDIARVFGVEFYEVDRRAYYAIPSWEKHQKIDRRSTRKFPGPPPKTPVSGTLHRDTAETHESPPRARRDAGAGTEEQRNRGTEEIGTEEHGDASAALIPPPPPQPDHFNEFWAWWPRKDGKAEARKAWEKARRSERPEVLVQRARAYAESPHRPERQYVPHASTWLNQRRWEDPLPLPPERRAPADRRIDDNLAVVQELAALDKERQR